MSKKIKEILESIDNEILTPDVKEGIVTAFTEEVKAATDDRVQIAVNEAVEQTTEAIDTEHAAQIEKLVESIDDAHTNVMKKLVEQIDISNSKKLQNVAEAYEKELTGIAEDYKKVLTERLSNFIDLRLDAAIPREQLEEAVQNIQARRMINEIRKVLAIDPEEMSDTVKEAIKEGYDQIEALSSALNESKKENFELQHKIDTINANMVLEQKTQGFDRTKKMFVEKIFAGKTADFITENFQYVDEMFEVKHKENDEVLVESAKVEAEKSAINVEVPKAIVTENFDENVVKEDGVDTFVQMMKAQDKR